MYPHDNTNEQSPSTKRCSRCEQDKPRGEFHKEKGTRDGLRNQCKNCTREMRVLATERRGEAIYPVYEKACTRCKEVKVYKEFYPDKRRRDGLYTHCKACHYEQTLAYARTDKGKAAYAKSDAGWYWERGGKEITKERNARPESRQRRYVYKRTPRGRYISQRTLARWRQENQDKNDAHLAVFWASRIGIIPHISTRECAGCGDRAEHYHHWSYKKEHWLDVVPLCESCHLAVHGKKKWEWAMPTPI